MARFRWVVGGVVLGLACLAGLNTARADKAVQKDPSKKSAKATVQEGETQAKGAAATPGVKKQTVKAHKQGKKNAHKAGKKGHGKHAAKANKHGGKKAIKAAKKA